MTDAQARGDRHVAGGPARELYTRYTYTGAHLEVCVAGAIARSVLAESDVAAEILELLSLQIAFFREGDLG